MVLPYYHRVMTNEEGKEGAHLSKLWGRYTCQNCVGGASVPAWQHDEEGFDGRLNRFRKVANNKMKLAAPFFCLVVLATAATASRWGSTPDTPDDSVCQPFLKKLSGLWDRKNKADSKVTLGRNGYKAMKVKRAKWEEEGCDCESNSSPFHKDLVFQRGKADHCKAMLCEALKEDVRCENVDVTAVACKVDQDDTGEHNPKLTDEQYKQKCMDGQNCCCPHDKRSFHHRLKYAGLKHLPRERKGDWENFCEYYENKGHSEGQFWHVLAKAGAMCDAGMGEKLWSSLCSNLGHGKVMLSGSAVSSNTKRKIKSKLRHVKAPDQKVAHKTGKSVGDYAAEAAHRGLKAGFNKLNKWATDVADSIGPVEVGRLEKRRL